jgi:hypothetical protein
MIKEPPLLLFKGLHSSLEQYIRNVGFAFSEWSVPIPRNDIFCVQSFSSLYRVHSMVLANNDFDLGARSMTANMTTSTYEQGPGHTNS